MTQEFQPCADPHNGMTKVPHTAHRFIGRTHEPLPPGGFPAFQEVVKHIDHHQDRIFHDDYQIFTLGSDLAPLALKTCLRFSANHPSLKLR